MTLPMNPASRVWPNWPRDLLIIPDIYEERNPIMTAMPALSTPTQIAILTAMDPTQMSLDGLLVHYNELVAATGQGSPRSAKFRDKPTGVKAIRGLLVQIAATANVPDPTPGLRRLRAAPQAEALRQKVLEDQEKATQLASKGRDAAPPVNEADPVPVAPRATGRASYADTARITVLVAENPKRAGSAAHVRFATYRPGMTVADYVAAVGDRRKALQDLGWDVAHGFVKVVG